MTLLRHLRKLAKCTLHNIIVVLFGQGISISVHFDAVGAVSKPISKYTQDPTCDKCMWRCDVLRIRKAILWFVGIYSFSGCVGMDGCRYRISCLSSVYGFSNSDTATCNLIIIIVVVVVEWHYWHQLISKPSVWDGTWCHMIWWWHLAYEFWMDGCAEIVNDATEDRPLSVRMKN